MTDPKPKGVPEWQRSSSADSDELKVIEPKPIPEASTCTESPATTSRAELVAQAGSWLEHQHIRDAPLEGKISFLEGKGLTKEEIHELLDLKDKKPASAEELVAKVPEAEAPASDEVTPPETTVPAERTVDESTPPIITYPEFLLKPPAKPPLVSRTALLRTAYGTAITAGALHLTSKYLVEPMVAELSDSRHQLFERATTHLDTLNGKLGGLVSVAPSKADINKHRTIHTDPAATDSESDTSSEASDPSEMFHRDIGVQTSGPPSPSSSSGHDALSAGGKIASQSAKLQALRAHLVDLHESGADSATAVDGVADEVSRLELYLDDLKYARRDTIRRSWESALPSGVTYTGGSLKKDKDEDEIDRVKAEIKGVKGVLLSAKSFPIGGRRTGTW